MDIGIISSRYARALLEFACGRGAEATVYEQTELFLKRYAQIPGIRQTVENPMVGTEEKIKLLRNATAGDATCEELTRFFALLLENKREKMMVFILHSYLYLYRKKKRIRQGLLVTATPLPEETLERLKRIILHFYRGRSVEFETKVDPAIIGGGILGMGYWRVDASVAGQLKKVKQQFIEKNRRIV